MKKLFALEDDVSTTNNNELLIDKILKANKKETSPISLTADILKEKEQIKKDVIDKISSSSTDENDITDKEDTTDKEDNLELDKEEDTSSDKDKEESTSSDTEEKKEEDKNKEESKDSDKDKEEKEDKEDKEDEEDDISKSSDDKESLKGLVGSGLKEESNKPQDKQEKSSPKQETNKEATESLSINHKPTLTNIFKPIHNRYNKYILSLESFNLPYKLSIEDQQIVYIKESVIESLNNLVYLSNNYIANNTTFIKKISQAVKSLSERLTIYSVYIEKEKYHFTQKLINDKDILSNLSVPNKSDIRTTIKILLNYIEDSTKAVTLILNNSFDKLESSYTTNNFEKTEEDLSYKNILPGFNLIKLHIDTYTNYLKTNIENYQYYKLKVFKTDDIFNLDAITINDDTELEYIINTANKLIGHISIIVDNLNIINNNFSKFIDEIKVMIYDINENKHKNLAEIGIDNKVKDFIKFKMIIEECIIDINVIIDYITSLETVINSCIELKE